LALENFVKKNSGTNKTPSTVAAIIRPRTLMPMAF
jgi:hypothetical protein